MTTPWILAFWNHFDAATRAQVLRALHQDRLLWNSLDATPLGWRALESLDNRPLSWQPENLARLAGELSSQPVSIPVQDQASPRQPLTLAAAGRLAGEMYTAGQGGADWMSTLTSWPYSQAEKATLLACLYGLASDPVNLLCAVINAYLQPGAISQALHALLCQPLPSSSQEDVLRGVLARQKPATRLSLIELLARQRSRMAQTLAQEWLKQGPEPDFPWNPEGLSPSQACAPLALDDYFSTLDQGVSRARLFALAGQADRARALLANAVQTSRRLEGGLASQLARAHRAVPGASRPAAGRSEAEAWNQAIHLGNGSPAASAAASAGLALTYLEAGQPADAERALAQAPGGASSPVVNLARAQLKASSGQADQARQAARQALALAQKDPQTATLWPAPFGEAGLQAFAGALARLFLDLRLPGEAALAADLALGETPLCRPLLELLAAACESQGSPDAALEAVLVTLSSLTEGETPSETLHRRLISALEATCAWSEALKERQRLIQNVQNPPAPDLYALAHCAFQAGQPAEALNAGRLVLSASPDDHQAHALCGEALCLMNQPARAAEHYRQAVRLAPHEAAYWLALARTLQQNNQPDAALEALQSASLAAPVSAEIHLALGEAYLAGGSPTRALAALQQAVTLAPLHGYAHKGASSAAPSPLAVSAAGRFGQALIKVGRQEEARQALAPAWRALENDPDGITPANLFIPQAYAQVLLELEAPDLARPVLEAVVEAAPSDLDCLLDLARACLLATPPAPQQAVPLLRQVLASEPPSDASTASTAAQPDPEKSQAKSDPEHGAAFYNQARAWLAEALAGAGEPSAAQETYLALLDSPLASQPTWRGRLYLGFGQVALSLGQKDTAIAALQEASQVEQLSLGLQKKLAEAYLACRSGEAALSSARNVLQARSEDPDTLAWFAGLALACGKDTSGGLSAEAGLAAQQSGIESLQHAVQLAPQRPDLRLQLGSAWQQSGHPTEAQDALLQLLTEPLAGQLSLEERHSAAQGLLQLGQPGAAAAFLAPLAAQWGAGSPEEGSSEDKSPGEEGTSFPPLALPILQTLARCYTQTGAPHLALPAIETAIRISPQEAGLYMEKAELHAATGDVEAALTSLEEALRLAPEDPGLHRQAAYWHARAGHLPLARQHAGMALDLLNQDSAPVLLGPALEARLLAAELAWAMLAPDTARRLLAGIMDFDLPTPIDANQSGSGSLSQGAAPQPGLAFRLACLAAELELNAGADEAAAQALERASTCEGGCYSRHPHLLALQNWAAARQGDFPVPLAASDPSAGTTPAPSGPVSDQALLRAQAQAALALAAWQPALALFEHLAASAPQEPRAQLLLARALVVRAEAQAIYTPLEAARRSPGEEASSPAAYSAALAALHAAGQLLHASDQGEAGQAELPAALRSLTRWRARLEAAFHPSRESAAAWQSESSSPEEMGAAILAWGRAGEAEAALRCASPYRQHPGVLLRLGLALIDTRPSVALEAVRRAVEAGTQMAGPAAEAPLRAVLLARLSPAPTPAVFQALEAALAAWPDEARWHALAARLLTQARPAKEVSPDDRLVAAAHLEKAVALEPGYAPHALSLSRLHQEDGQPDRARQVLQNATQGAPHQPELWLELAHLQAAAGDLDAAAFSADSALEIDPELDEAALLRAEITLRAGNARSAFLRLQTLVSRCPDNPGAWQSLALALEELNRPEEALDALAKALPLVNTPLTLQRQRARLLRLLPDKRAALKEWQALAERYPDDPTFLVYLAEGWLEAGNAEASQEAARRALQADRGRLSLQEQAGLHFLLGQGAHQSGQLDGSVFHLNEALRLLPDDLPSHLELAQVFAERRQYPQALKIFRTALRLAPDNPRVYYLTALALKESKDYVGAETMLRRAVQLDPNEVSYHRLLAAIVAINLVHNRRTPAWSFEADDK